MLLNTSSDLISDMWVIDQKHYDQQYRKKNREYSSSGILFKKRSFWKLVISLEIYMKQTLTSGCYGEDLIFLENNIVWFWTGFPVNR